MRLDVGSTPGLVRWPYASTVNRARAAGSAGCEVGGYPRPVRLIRPPRTVKRCEEPGGFRSGYGTPTDLAAHESRSAQRCAAKGPAARHRPGRQRPGGAAEPGRPPDLPRRRHGPAQPGLPGSARPGGAGPPRRGNEARRRLPGPGRLHRGQRLGRPRRRRPAARPGDRRLRATVGRRDPGRWGGDGTRSCSKGGRRPGQRRHRRADGPYDLSAPFQVAPRRRADRERRGGPPTTAPPPAGCETPTWRWPKPRTAAAVASRVSRCTCTPTRSAAAGARPATWAARASLGAGVDRPVPAGGRPGDVVGDRGRGAGAVVVRRRSRCSAGDFLDVAEDSALTVLLGVWGLFDCVRTGRGVVGCRPPGTSGRRRRLLDAERDPLSAASRVRRLLCSSESGPAG